MIGDPRILVPVFRYTEAEHAGVTPIVEILGADESRVLISLTLEDAFGATVYLRPIGFTSWRVTVLAGQPPVELKFRDYGPLLGRAWETINLGAGQTLWVLSASFVPQARE